MNKKLIPKHLKAGKLLKNEPIQDGIYVEQPRLNLQEQELLNFIQSNPTPEQIYFRDLAIKNGESPVLQEILEEAEKDNAKNNFFRGYNNFRYSHPWAEGLNYTPIIGDVMHGISLAGDINNKNYTNAAIGLGLMALPNFIERPLKKYKKLKKRYKDYYTIHKNGVFNNYEKTKDFVEKIALRKYPDLSNPFDKKLAFIESNRYKDLVNDKIEFIQDNTLLLYKNLNNKDYARLANMINLSPEYGIFLQQNPNLNPLSLETLNKFFNRQSTSIRGVTAINDLEALKYITTPPLGAFGGDRLKTKGLYTSNSYNIADAFSRPDLYNKNINSYIGIVKAPFNIDKNLSFENQLKLYRSYIDHYHDLGLSTHIPGTLVKEATYVRRNGDHYNDVIERSFYPKENGETVVLLESMTNNGPLENLHGRWGNPNMKSSKDFLYLNIQTILYLIILHI